MARTRPIPTVPPYRIQVGGTALEGPIDPATYIVGPGDVFLISIVGLEPYLIQVTVTPTGSLVLPQIGSLHISSLTAAEVSRKTIALIKSVRPTYDADCTLYGIREVRISLTGAVTKPAFYRVTPLSRLSDLLSLAGGWKANGALHRIEITSGDGHSRTVDLTRYFYEGDFSQNPHLKAGDRVVVPFSDIQHEMVSVRGLATVPAYYAIRPGESLATFIGRWYDARSKADISGVELHHTDANGQTVVQDVSAQDFPVMELQPGDIVYINAIAGVDVLGEVRKPGRYEYQPGLTAEDYVTYAVGRTSEGSRSKVRITRADGQVVRGRDTEIQPGDVIHVPRSTRSVMVGQAGFVQVGLAVLNMVLILVATGR
ncbi:MAG: SLBB domain-containing protein [Candidatus Marinimicrobia bacterium]|nr:SLBB domain-containing protein [Candidatus Neomarinimicrobiota bacterium]